MTRGIHDNGACVAGGMCGRWHVWQGGMHGRVGVCMAHMPPVDRMTDMCKHITLPQTSFVGGNNRDLLCSKL